MASQKRIGIVGGGQLARMMIQESHHLGFEITVLDPTPESPGGQVANRQIVADYTDKKALSELAEASDFITIEVEIDDEEVLHQTLSNFRALGKIVNPPPEDLAIIQDKLKQKEFLRVHQVPTAPFMEVSHTEDIIKAAEIFNYPIILKSRTGGYDGRGNALIKSSRDIEKAVSKLDPHLRGDDKSLRLYVEQFVPFTKELSVIMARSTTGETASYPTLETIHKNNICHIVIAPARIAKDASKKTQEVARNVLNNLKGAGVYTVEMFLTKDGEVLVNEIAPRVHNSGHLTIEACETSQFEQHIRAITGMPLGKTNLKVKAAVMINILGERDCSAQPKGEDDVLAIPGATVHIYGKLMTKHERKMGHITVIGETVEEALEKAKRARSLITI